MKLNKGHYTDAGARAYSAAGPDGFVTQIEGTASSIVLSSIGARCGKAFLTDGPWTTLANTQVIIPNPDIAIASFLHAILDDETYWNRSGSAQPFIKPSDVKGAWVPLPPLDEQRRIGRSMRRSRHPQMLRPNASPQGTLLSENSYKLVCQREGRDLRLYGIK